MNKTKIDWCDMTWNPVTGCLHGCEYCYARGIAKRFGSAPSINPHDKLHVIERPQATELKPIIQEPHGTRRDPYPFGFEPTLHEYRITEPLDIKDAQTIFTCSMADLFGNWVPGEWSRKIFDTCVAAYWHRYLFLTKNPKGIDDAIDNYTGEERGCGECYETFKPFWFGTSITCQNDLFRMEELSQIEEGHKFISIEPIHGKIDLTFKKERCPACGSSEIYQDNPKTAQGAPPFYCDFCGEWESNDGSELKPSIEWVIVGAETGNRKGKVIPEFRWIDGIVRDCRQYNIPVFMKESLHSLMGGADFIQELPKELQ